MLTTDPLESSIQDRLPLREAVYQRLKQAIVDGHLVPGEHLIETEIAKRLGVSRNPVREAIRKLEQEQLVNASTQGMIVSRITSTKVEEVYMIRAELEALCCRLAAARITPQEAERLRQIVAGTRRAVASNNLQEMIICNDDFHKLLLEASRSTTLTTILNQVRDSVMRFRYATIPLPGRPTEMLRDHANIAEAVIAGDAGRAASLMHAHILEAGQRLVATLVNGE